MAQALVEPGTRDDLVRNLENVNSTRPFRQVMQDAKRLLQHDEYGEEQLASFCFERSQHLPGTTEGILHVDIDLWPVKCTIPFIYMVLIRADIFIQNSS